MADAPKEIGRLYGLPPEEFIAARDETVRRLRDEGSEQEARAVKARRRPTVAAWALNQVARGNPKGIAELLDAGQRLRDVHRRAVSGARADGLREAGEERRRIIARLTSEAEAVLRHRGEVSPSHLEAVADTLEAASVDPEAGEELRTGTLERTLPAPSGFETTVGLVGAPQESAPKGRKKKETPEQAARGAAKAAREAEHAGSLAERRLERARRAVEQARADRDRVGRLLQEMTQRAEEAERSIEEAEAHVARVESEAEEARRLVKKERGRADRAAKRVKGN